MCSHSQGSKHINVWYVDSGCSMHMTRDRNKFISLKENKDGTMSFGNDGSSNIIGEGTVTLGSKDAFAKDVSLFENMNHNMLSVGQMCDQGHAMLFNSNKCEIKASLVKLWLQQAELQTTYIFWMRHLKGVSWKKKTRVGYGTNE